MTRLLLPAALAWASCALAADLKGPLRVLDQPPKDTRLGKPKDYNGYFPWTPPADLQHWDIRRRNLREQVLVALGLWPLPEKTPLKPVVHGKIDRDDYTVEKVFFASYPGHYVTGNLYRPKGKSGRSAGVLCPHGHWPNGRFFDAGDKAAEQALRSGAEKTKEGAHYLLQARCAQLARMGCVVFHYDMVGYADSKAIGHRSGFLDAEAELRLQNFMGLQTWNSIRALDFLTGLPDVDSKRIGVTGASGGGTQTFILCAVDDRPTVAVPAVMVSTAMQGGCICENCSYLRLGTGNIELAGLFAPKPLALIGADDWTIDIEAKGYPELRSLYKLYGAEDRVSAKCFKQFKHNYNQVSREFMYNWLNQYLHLGQPTPVVEKPFVPVPPKELSVFDAEHPLPKDSATAEELRKYLTATSDKRIASLLPKDGVGLQEFRRIMTPALRTMIGDHLPDPIHVEAKEVGRTVIDKVAFQKLRLARKGQGEEIPAVLAVPPGQSGAIVVWVHPAGKASLLEDGKLSAAARQILEKKAAILAPDVFLTGELSAKPPAVNAQYAGYTFGYNRPLLANRVHDILTAVAYTRGLKDTQVVHLVGWEKAGPWVVLARALSADAVARTAADLDQFRFDQVRALSDDMMLPGALKYGGLPAFAALCAPGDLYLHNHRNTGMGEWVKPAYQAAGGKDRLGHLGEKASAEKVVGWLLR